MHCANSTTLLGSGIRNSWMLSGKTKAERLTPCGSLAYGFLIVEQCSFIASLLALRIFKHVYVYTRGADYSAVWRLIGKRKSPALSVGIHPTTHLHVKLKRWNIEISAPLH